MKETTMSDFNKQQQQAVDFPSTKDLLISAGAGSGKTKTLSERVHRLISEKEVDPSSLLVLTFTDNAAHEMKERIVGLFRKDEDPERRKLGDQMQSAHIQTFDSFCQYLVSTYAGRLGLSSALSVLDETIEETKKNEYLDETLNEYYEDPSKREKLISTLKKLDVKGDSQTRAILLNLDAKLNSLLRKDREDFLQNYKERFLSEEMFSRCYEAFVESIKEDVRLVLLEARYYDNYCGAEGDEDGNDCSIELTTRPFETPSFCQETYYLAREKEYCMPLSSEINRLLSLDAESFVKEAKKWGNKDNFQKQFHSWPSTADFKEKEGGRYLIDKTVFYLLKNVFQTKGATLAPIYALDSKEKEYEKLLSFQDDVMLLLDIVKEMEAKLSSYKRTVNCFTFSDIQAFALSLFEDDRFQDIAEEIRSRFTYIMVDEYQDTNDFQECFINALLKPNASGSRAHLFCVGDPKQAIYGFRNSNVKLFMARQESLQEDEVIHMNKNYRSGEKLLMEINTLFSAYMSKDHGDVDYTLPSEQLTYDKNADLFGEKPYGHFGISRIVSPEGNYQGVKPLEWEIQAICHDIQAKVKDPKFLVYDLKCPEKLRRARYGDFAILCRKKTSFLAFQKAFVEAGIPINIKVTNNLRELSCVLALESLLALLDAIATKNDGDLRHLFASVARSYLFEYSDAKLFDLLTLPSPEDKNPLAKIKSDPLFVKCQDFALRHEKTDFPSVFRDLIQEFGLLSSLYKIGNVSDNVSKIESLYSLAVQESHMGEGLHEFVSLFSSIKKYDLQFKSDSSFASENSVDLMTIHASKGLERLFVYMPVSQNSLGGGGNQGPNYDFSEKYGVLLPYYDLPEEFKGDYSVSTKTIPNALYDKEMSLHNVEEDEHVRIFYVAFTRAVDSLIIVGDDAKKKKGNLYEALNYLPHHRVFEPSLLREKLESEASLKKAYDAYNEKVQEKDALPSLSFAEFRKGHSEEDAIIAFRRYQILRKKLLVDPADEAIKASFEALEVELFKHYVERLKDKSDDYDLLAKVFSKIFGISRPVSSYLDLLDPSIDSKNNPEAEKELKKRLAAYLQCLTEQKDEEKLGIHLTKEQADDENKKAAVFASAFLQSLACALDGYPYVSRISYENPHFSDPVAFYSYSKPETSTQSSPFKEAAMNSGKALDDAPILFEEKEHERASKKAIPLDPDSPIQPRLEYGTRLHRYMELVDFKTKDTSFILNPQERAKIDKVLSNPFFKAIQGYDVYKEYAYFDTKRGTTGFIDLLLRKGDKFLIVDYKTRKISDPEYAEQLSVYRENVCRLFKAKKEDVRCFLLPLTGDSPQEIELV